MDERILLEVSEHQGCFHFNTDEAAISSGHGSRFDDWAPLGVMPWSEAGRFTQRIWGKYGNRLPDMETVREEFSRFVSCAAGI